MVNWESRGQLGEPGLAGKAVVNWGIQGAAGGVGGSLELGVTFLGTMEPSTESLLVLPGV